ncbi:MAG: glycosyltransferase family 4 protein [Planctomycetes bacterium]|nr:glycosyltransferase family 4 protein [Planctomycetota bacterium]
MKILHVNPTFGVVGGTETYLHNLIGDLAARGHVSEVVAEEDLTDGTVAPFHPLAEVFTPGKRWRWRHGGRLKAILHRVDPDVVHLHNTMNADLVRIAAAHRPTLRFVHDHTLFCPGLNKVFADGGLCERPMGRFCLEKYAGGGCVCFRHPTRAIARRFLARAEKLVRVHRRLARLVVASHYMRGELERVGLAAERITVNPYYTSVPEPRDATEDDPPLVLTLCRMSHPDKGVIPLLDALERIAVPYRARIVGAGQHEEMIRRHARRLELDGCVEFPGFLPHAQALELLWRARVVAFPSMWHEPFGIVGIEALARGKPVVAFDVGGVREWLDDGRTGILVPRGDVGAFAAALTALLTDPARARALGAAGPEQVRSRFVKERHLDVLERVYREVAGR